MSRMLLFGGAASFHDTVWKLAKRTSVSLTSPEIHIVSRPFSSRPFQKPDWPEVGALVNNANSFHRYPTYTPVQVMFGEGDGSSRAEGTK